MELLFIILLQTANKSVPSEFPPNQLEIEVRNATKVLGILPEHLFVFNYEVRKLNYVRQEILESLILLRKKIDLNIIYIPSPRDIHQDHSTVANEAIRAFKTKTIYGYELIWNNIDFKPNPFIVLQHHVAKKIEALNASD